ncbi:MAG TPA: glycosyltransferase [Actinomycetes bacterium]|jgi:glycosyltransferase involved in cell wall biosynthesis|nr:glycosyltransferase [Actinomycetes bacterium]
MATSVAWSRERPQPPPAVEGGEDPAPCADLCLHDFAFQWGGAERVFGELVRLSAASRVSVVAGDTALLRRHLPGRQVEQLDARIGSNLQSRLSVPRLARALPRRRAIPGRMLCSSYSVARWLRSEDPRLVYCHAPMRQIWHGFGDYTTGLNAQSLALRAFGSWLRSVDRAATQRHDYVVVPSSRVADLLLHAYGTGPRAIVPPPVDDDYFAAELPAPGEHFVWVGRVVAPIKRLALLCKVFAGCRDRQLLVVGDGRSRRAIQKHAPPNVRFLGWRSPLEIRRLVASAQALLLPSMEDFGLCAAEALALGTPVIVTRRAGISSWVQAGATGIVAPWDYEGYRRAVLRFRRGELAPPAQVRQSARAFSRSGFRAAMRAAMKDLQWLP